MLITNEDNMELMARYEDNHFDLAIVDPPYGIERFKKGGSIINKYGSENRIWNNEKPTEQYFNELFRVSKKQIIWGSNNFNLPTSEYFIVWQKGNALDFSFAMVEQAWTNVKKPAKLFKYLHVQNNEKRIHATQKPVSLYEFCLSIALACHNLGYDLTACELDKDYYEAAIKRIDQHKAQIRMF